MSINGAAHAHCADAARPHGHLRFVGGDQTVDLVAAEQATLDLLVALARGAHSEHHARMSCRLTVFAR